MSSTFEQLAADAAALLAEQFGETWTYTPSGGSARSVKFHPVRGVTVVASDDGGMSVEYQLTGYLDRAEVTTIVRGGDYLDGPTRVDGSSNNYRIGAILGQTLGMWHVALKPR